MENDEEKKNRRGKRLAGCQSWWTNGRVGKRTKKSSFTAKVSSHGSGTGCETGVGSNLDASGIFFEMPRGRGTCRRMPGIARETGSSCFVEHSNLCCGASFADEKTRKKKTPNRSLVEAKSDLPCSRVWSVRRVKLRLNTAPPCCHDCNQMAFLIAVCVTL